MPEEQRKVSWFDLLPIITQYGLPLAEKLWVKLASGLAPTQADWDELKESTYQMAKDRMLKVLLDSGIDPASDQGKMFLALASKA